MSTLLIGACATASTEWDPGLIAVSEARTPEIVIRADPYVEDDRQTERFGVILTDGGVLAIEVSVENLASAPLVVRQSEMSLILADGTELIPAPAGQVAARVESAPIGEGASVASALIHPFVGLFAIGADEEAQNEQYQRLRDLLFGDAMIGGGETAAGIVFFIPPDDKISLKAERLAARIVRVNEGTSFFAYLQF